VTGEALRVLRRAVGSMLVGLRVRAWLLLHFLPLAGCSRGARGAVVTFMQVYKALVYGESRVLRCYARDGRVLIPSSTGGHRRHTHAMPLHDQALEIVSDKRKLAEFERHLLPKTTKPPAHASRGLRAFGLEHSVAADQVGEVEHGFGECVDGEHGGSVGCAAVLVDEVLGLVAVDADVLGAHVNPS
jgi:hypothetical protein